MRVLVAGGSGFAGSHVADAFSDAGHAVTVLDRVGPTWLRPDQRYVAADILNADEVLSAVAGHDVVCNFAGMADIAECQERPRESALVNVVGNVNLLEAARQGGATRYLLASTVYVYSEAGGLYRASKQACELYVEEYERRFGLGFTILRFGTLYGPRANDFNSVRRYLRQALLERRIREEGTGDEVREYIHVADAARLVVRCLDRQFVNERVILSGQQAMKFADLLTMVSEIVGGAEIELAPPVPGITHYAVTPYTFRPKKAFKLTSDRYTDLGQGLLECLEELYVSEGLGTRPVSPPTRAS